MFYPARSIVHTVGRLSGAAATIGLTRVNGHADPPVPAVALIAGTQVLVWSSVDTGGLSVTHPLQTRIYG